MAIIGAVLASAIATAFAVVNTLNADHFALLALSGRVEAVEQNIVPRNEIVLELRNIDVRLTRIEKLLEK